MNADQFIRGPHLGPKGGNEGNREESPYEYHGANFTLRRHIFLFHATL